MKTKRSLMLLCMLPLVCSMHAATTRPVPYKRINFSDSAGITLTDPGSKAVNQIGSKRLSWYRKTLLKVIEKKLGKRVLYEGNETSKSRKSLSVVSVITAFLGLIIIVTGLGPIGLVLSLVGLITGIIALSDNNSKKHKRMATWGVVVSGVTIGLAIVSVALLAALFS